MSTDQFVCRSPGWLPSDYGRESHNGRFHGGTICNDAASGLIWVENQVSLGASETITGKERFEQWLYNIACIEVKQIMAIMVFSHRRSTTWSVPRRSSRNHSQVWERSIRILGLSGPYKLSCIWLAPFWCIQVYTGWTWGLMTSPFGLLL